MLNAADSDLTKSSHPKHCSLNALNPNEWATQTTSFGNTERKGSMLFKDGGRILDPQLE